MNRNLCYVITYSQWIDQLKYSTNDFQSENVTNYQCEVRGQKFDI